LCGPKNGLLSRDGIRHVGVVSEFTVILQQIDAGDTAVADRILPLVYDELRKLAAAKMARESASQTLQPTALVHEAWLRLGGEAQPSWKNRAHFFSAAAEAMRRILIENARRRHAVRHGGGLEKLSANATGFELTAPADDEELLLVHEALDALAVEDPRKAELVKQFYFVGLTLEEAAAVVDLPLRTAERHWAYARAWLAAEIGRLRGQ
jgi:RNA polymerase sigma factor (TIGR02999 family)